MSGDVIVPASSKQRDRFFASKFLFWNSILYMRPGSTIEMYWSDVMMLAPIQVSIVVVIRLPVLCTKERA